MRRSYRSECGRNGSQLSEEQGTVVEQILDGDDSRQADRPYYPFMRQPLAPVLPRSFARRKMDDWARLGKYGVKESRSLDTPSPVHAPAPFPFPDPAIGTTPRPWHAWLRERSVVWPTHRAPVVLFWLGCQWRGAKRRCWKHREEPTDTARCTK